MNLAFKTLDIEHFRCFAAKQTFQLTPSPGLWFLRGKNEVEPQLGSNGSGKSSLITALCWVIYGQTPQGLRNTDIKPWRGKGTPVGVLTLLIDGEEVSIRRTAKTNGVAINGKEVGVDEAAKLLNLPFEVLTNTLLLAQGQPLFFDRTPKEKLQLFTDVLRLERWEERSVKASKRVRELETIEAEMAGERSGFGIALSQTEALLKRAQEESQEWEAERQKKAQSSAGEIKELETRLASQQKLLDDADLAHDGAWLKLREMREDITSLQEASNEARRNLDAAELSIASDKREETRLRRELKTLGESDNCPTCGQPVTGTDLGKHKKELLAQIKALETRIESGVPKKVSQAYAGAQKLLSGLSTQIREAEKATDALQSRLNLHQPIVAELKSQIMALKNKKKVFEGEANPHVNQIHGLRRQKAKLTQDIEALDEDILKAQRQMERTKFWIKGFKDVALYLIEEVLQELEAVTNSILSEVGLVSWQVKYDIERETKSGTTQRGINVVVTPPQEVSVSSIKWESWSGGESQRLRLVGALALSEVLLRYAGVSTNLEIFDEPTRGLSIGGVTDLVEYLAARAVQLGKSIWLIDHMAIESSKFAGTVTVTKRELGSVIG